MTHDKTIELDDTMETPIERPSPQEEPNELLSIQDGWNPDDSLLMEHAKTELDLLLKLDPDASEEDVKIQQEINEHVLDLVEVFAQAGHSGSTAAWTIAVLNKLLQFQVLTPISGNDDEWTEVVDATSGEPNAPIYQNKRRSSVLKDATGVYDLDGKVFVSPDGAGHTNSESRVYIESFPYYPHTEYIRVDDDGNIKDLSA